MYFAIRILNALLVIFSDLTDEFWDVRNVGNALPNCFLIKEVEFDQVNKLNIEKFILYFFISNLENVFYLVLSIYIFYDIIIICQNIIFNLNFFGILFFSTRFIRNFSYLSV